MVSSSTTPTVPQKYPLAHICCPQYFFLISGNSSCSMCDERPFNLAILVVGLLRFPATLYIYTSLSIQNGILCHILYDFRYCTSPFFSPLSVTIYLPHVRGSQPQTRDISLPMPIFKNNTSGRRPLRPCGAPLLKGEARLPRIRSDDCYKLYNVKAMVWRCPPRAVRSCISQSADLPIVQRSICAG